MFEDNPIFNKPKNENIKIWRYIDFTKYLSMIDKKSLYFSRADKLGDPFEGSWPLKDMELRNALIEKFLKDSKKEKNKVLIKWYNDELSKMFKDSVKHTAVNCWHENCSESVAMWSIYSKNNKGIAIQSTYRKLKNSIIDDKKVNIGEINYIDYKTESINNMNIHEPFMYKRKSYEYEKEIRAFHTNAKKKNNSYDYSTKSLEDGIFVDVDLNELIENIYLSPKSPSWFRELVESINKKYNFNFRIIQSSLDEDPMF